MKEYFKKFKVLFIIMGVLLVVYMLLYGVKMVSSSMNNKPRGNKDCKVTERVFDKADVLTDSEEAALRELIAKREVQTGSDIVLITLNESLEEYAKQYDEYASGNDYTMIYADNFWDENRMGYNRAYGDGILLVDNWYREADGNIYTWICTTGKVEDKYSDAMLNRMLDKVYAHIENNPYEAYRAYIEQFYSDMAGTSALNITFFNFKSIWIFSLIVAVIFVVANNSFRVGKKTTTASTYVNMGRAQFPIRSDQFMHKTVRSRRIETSSGGSGGGGRSGGGGHHRSSGGHSHGGAGRSR